MDYSISVDGLDRPSIMVKLQLHHSKQNTAKLRQNLSKDLKKHHPIHLTLNLFDKIWIKNIAKIINVNVEQKTNDKLKTEIANYFFLTYPNSPLTELTFLIEQLHIYKDTNTDTDTLKDRYTSFNDINTTTNSDDTDSK